MKRHLYMFVINGSINDPHNTFVIEVENPEELKSAWRGKIVGRGKDYNKDNRHLGFHQNGWINSNWEYLNGQFPTFVPITESYLNTNFLTEVPKVDLNRRALNECGYSELLIKKYLETIKTDQLSVLYNHLIGLKFICELSSAQHLYLKVSNEILKN